MDNIKISGIKEWYLILLLIITIFNVFVIIQPYSQNTYYIYDNKTIEHSLDTIHNNCGSVHMTEHNNKYYIFKTVIENNKEYYCNIPLDECLDNDNINFMKYCNSH